MTESPTPEPLPESCDSLSPIRFESSSQSTHYAPLLLAGGVGLILLALAIFAWVLISATALDQITLQSITTLPILAGIGMIVASRQIKKSCNAVIVDEVGLILEEENEPRELRWQDMGWAKVDQTAMGSRRLLTIYDRDGKTLAKLDEKLDNFDDLAEYVKSRIDEDDRDTAQHIQLGKARKQAVLLVAVGLVFLLLGGFLFYDGVTQRNNVKLLETQGIAAMGHVDELVLAPNGVTKRLYYTVTCADTGRTADHNVEVEPAAWELMQSMKEVPITTVSGRPDISRLDYGQVMEDDPTRSPIGGILFAIGAGLLSLFMIGAGVMSWMGWDIDLDSKTGKVSIQRFGEGK